MSAETFAEIWPNGPISEAEWRQRMADLATEAEGLIGRRPTLQQACRLAMQWAGLAWAAMSPEVIAMSCRASLLPGMGPPGVVVAEGLPDQLDEISDRLDAIFEAGRSDPSALVVQQQPPVIFRPPAEGDKPRGRPKPAQPRPTLRPAAERMAPRPAEPEPLEAAPPADPEPLQLPEPLELPPPLELPEPLELPPPLELPEPLQMPPPLEVEELEPTPEAEHTPEALEPPSPPKRRRRAEPPPAGWFTQAELSELLEVGASTVSRWRLQGLAGEEGSDWRRCGRPYYYSPQLAEALLQAQAQAAPQAAPAVPPADPERWLTTAEMGAWFGLSAPWIARARRLGQLREGIHYRKALAGEFPGDPDRSRGWVHDLQPCLAALAEATGRPVPDQPINDPKEARRASQEAARLRAQACRTGRACLEGEQQESTPPLGADL